MTGRRFMWNIVTSTVVLLTLAAFVIAGCATEEGDLVSPEQGRRSEAGLLMDCEIVNGDFSGGFTGWETRSEGPGLMCGVEEIVDVDERSQVLHLDSRACGNYYLFYVQTLPACGIVGRTLSWDWKLAEIERDYGLAAVFVKFFDNSSVLLGEYFVRRDTGDFWQYDCPGFVARMCTENPGIARGCERVTGTAFGWETHSINFTDDFFNNLECNPIDPEDINSIQVWVESYNNAGSGVDAYFDNFVYAGPAGPVEVTLDIKPRSCPNRLHPKSKGVLPAAILGSVDFDVQDIDVATVLLEGVPPERTRIRDVSSPSGGMAQCSCSDERADGFDDLTLRFRTEDIIGGLGSGNGADRGAGAAKRRGKNGPQAVAAGDTRLLTITGRLLDGTPFEGRDCVLIKDGEPDCVEARWLFEENGDDETGRHDCTLFGGAMYVPTPQGWGLHTSDPSSYASYDPPIAEMASGELVILFMLDEPFFAMPSYGNPIVIINSNHDGHNVGDMSVRLDPADGKLRFVQENALPEWTLKTAKANWDAGVWYEVSVSWGLAGRRIEVRWPSGMDAVSDDVVSPCFSSSATLKTLASRASDSPPNGLTIDRLELRCGGEGRWPQGTQSARRAVE